MLGARLLNRNNFFEKNPERFSRSSVGHTSEVMKKHYLDLSDEEFAEAAEASLAGLESPVPHAPAHATQTETDDKLE